MYVKLMKKMVSNEIEIYTKQCNLLRKNEYIIIKGRPCKVVDIATCK